MSNYPGRGTHDDPIRIGTPDNGERSQEPNPQYSPSYIGTLDPEAPPARHQGSFGRVQEPELPPQAPHNTQQAPHNLPEAPNHPFFLETGLPAEFLLLQNDNGATLLRYRGWDWSNQLQTLPNGQDQLQFVRIHIWTPVVPEDRIIREH